MNAPISDDGEDSEHSKYAPKRFREQQRMPGAAPFYVKSAPTVPSPTDVNQDRQTRSEFASWPERNSESSGEDKTMTRMGRILTVVSFATLVALATIFAKPLWQDAGALLNADSQTSQALKPSDRLTASDAPANNAPVPATTIAAAPGAKSSASEPAKQAALSSSPQEPRSTFRGVTDSEIRFGISAALSGPTKELGQNMNRGIVTAFNVANANGGVHGRQLRLIAADDGYEPARAAETMKQLFEKDQVFGVVGNVGTPTAVVALPYALERKMLFFGAFTGAGLLRSDPPDRYVFNYRASYAEETAATVQYLVKVRRLKPAEIAVFAQQDPYGDSGFAGVAKAVRSLGGNDSTILRLNYQRNTVDVDEAVAQLNAYNSNKSRIPIRAVIMVPAYRAAAKFIEKTRDLYPDMIYTSVSFVGSTALANELMLLGKRYATGVIVTQVVPAVDGHSSLVLNYKTALAKYFPGEAPDYVSLEGYVAASVLIEALKRNGRELDTERLVATLENLRDLDIGLGTPVTFSRSEHQGVHKVWGTQLDGTGRYQAVDLQ
jgi:ABC-type branched-subunit amino acid transport system substrate-binding protein